MPPKVINPVYQIYRALREMGFTEEERESAIITIGHLEPLEVHLDHIYALQMHKSTVATKGGKGPSTGKKDSNTGDKGPSSDWMNRDTYIFAADGSIGGDGGSGANYYCVAVAPIDDTGGLLLYAGPVHATGGLGSASGRSSGGKKSEDGGNAGRSSGDKKSAGADGGNAGGSGSTGVNNGSEGHGIGVTRACFFCDQPDHFVTECPILASKRSN